MIKYHATKILYKRTARGLQTSSRTKKEHLKIKET